MDYLIVSQLLSDSKKTEFFDLNDLSDFQNELSQKIYKNIPKKKIY